MPKTIEDNIEKIIDNEEYDSIKTVFSLEERKNILFNKYTSNNEFIKNLFSEQEALDIYYTCDESTKKMLIFCFGDKLKETFMNSFDTYFKTNIILSFSTDEKKVAFLEEVEDYYKVKILQSLKDDRLKIEYAKHLDDYFSFIVFASLESDNLKIECLKYLKNDNAANIIIGLKDDNEKIKLLDRFTDNFKTNIINSFKTDELKVKYLPLLSDYFKTNIIIGLKDDKFKITLLDGLKDESKIEIISSFKSTKLKLECLNKINDISKIKAIIDHIDFFDTDMPIYENIIEKYAKEFGLNIEHLKIMIKSFGYYVLKFISNDNIVNVINLNDDDFTKYLNIFSNTNMDMCTVNTVSHSLLQRKFKLEFKEIYSIFSILEGYIEKKNEDKIRNILHDISNNINIDKFLEENALDFNSFIEGLLQKKYLNVLHDITDAYIKKQRNAYVNFKLVNINEELNLDFRYEKNFVLKFFINNTPTNEIIALINKIDPDKLTDKMQELISNPKLLEEIIKFKKCPTENTCFNKYLKTFNEILSILYTENYIDTQNIMNPEKRIYFPKQVHLESLISIMAEIDTIKLRDNLFSNEIIYNNLLKVLSDYKLLGWGDTYDKLLNNTDLKVNKNVIASLIESFYKICPKMTEQLNSGVIKSITLPGLIENACAYSSSSSKYLALFGIDNYNLLFTNPDPNSAPKTKNERIKQALMYITEMYKREYVTVPSIDENIVINGKEINVNLGNFTDMINLTYGERTGSCMRIGGQGNSLFDFCITNKNGFHIRFSDPTNGNFISRVSGFRNGNTVFLNQLRYSTHSKYTNNDIISACKKAAKLIILYSKNSEFPIDNVVISRDKAMENSKTIDIGVTNIKKGYTSFYTDINNHAVVLATSLHDNNLVDINLNNIKEIKYQTIRQKVLELDEKNYKILIYNIAKIQIINQLLKGISFDDCILNVENEIVKCYVGEDWYITMDIMGNISSLIIENSPNKDRALKEMQEYINKITVKPKMRIKRTKEKTNNE